jgi:isoleucyl-tRNA synthetase
MFKSVPSQMDFVEQEHEILRFWEEIGAFEKLVALRAKGPRWSFIDGPITANNPMGLHHGWGRTYKDLFQRFKAMQGFRTRYQNGFDCQGLWVEVNVEKDMGFKTKRDIESYGLAEFVVLCKQRVLSFAAVQTEQSVRLGYWMDWNDPDLLRLLERLLGEDPSQDVTLQGPRGPVTDSVEGIVGRLGMPELGGSYFTFSDENNYAIWSVLKSCHDRGWIYKGTDVMPWCSRCGTGLSQHEIVTEGYQELVHPSLTLRLPLRERPGESLLVWTTTPWTLTSNVAAAVGPALDYVRVRQGDEVFYLGKGTVHTLRGAYQIEAELKGSEMVGWTYRGPFDELPVQVSRGGPQAHRVIAWDEVGEEEGTGIVHIAPGCGAEDFQLSKVEGLPVIAPLDEAGVFVQGFGWLTGRQVHDVAQPIFDDLHTKGLGYRVEDYTHRYPVCWRCGDELVFRLVDEWFISMGEQLDKPYEEVTEAEKARNLRYQIMEVVTNETRWYPSFGYERELDWLRNMHDWMISKKRYWGLALPIYECTQCGRFEVLGSKGELRQRAVEGWEAFEGHTPHRPFVDAVKIACSACGAKVSRIPDVGNPWLDAGIVAMSTLGYNSDRQHWAEWFPADLISESFPGQFRNWFYSLLAMSTILERRAPFKHVFTYGTLVGEDGRPMHKSWGNAIEFNEAADQIGVDVMRWMYCDHKPEKDLWFGFHRADEARRQFLIPLWNVYSFFVTYAAIDGWRPDDSRALAPSLLDRWILARLHQLVGVVTQQLETFEPNGATASVSRFIDELSNWYLRRSRRRFWARAGSSAAADADKDAAYDTLYRVLVTLTRLLAPFVPFVTEAMYQNLVRRIDPQAAESVHHSTWPQVEAERLDERLIADMALVMRLVSLGHAARNSANRKLRQPLAEAAFAVAMPEERATVEAYADLIADELNVKAVRLLDAAAEAVNFSLNPYPRQLGQKYGPRFPAVRQAVLALPPDQAAARLLAGQAVGVEVDGRTLEVLPEEVEVRLQAHPGLAAAAEGAYVAALQIELSEALKREGLAREFVRRVQEQRKVAGLHVADRVSLRVHASDGLAAALSEHDAYVRGETLAVSLETAETPSPGATEHAFEGEWAWVLLARQGAG